MTLDTLALIQNKLEARGIPARLQARSNVARPNIRVWDFEHRLLLEFVEHEGYYTLACQVWQCSRLIETIETDIASNTTDAEAVADWIAGAYSAAIAAKDKLPHQQAEEMKAEYDFSKGVRGKYDVNRAALGALTDQEQSYLIEGLQALLKFKQEALEIVNAPENRAVLGGHVFTEQDFGIPQIRALSFRLGNAFYGPEEEETKA